LRESIFFKENNLFKLFGLEHIMVYVFFVIFGYLLIVWAKKQPENTQIKVGNYFAFSLSITVIIWSFLKVYVNKSFDIQNDLPFHLCNLLALLLPIFSMTRKYVYYEILLFLILFGPLQATFTPSLVNSFPHFNFIKYWYVHAGTVVFIFYATFVYNMKPTLKSAVKSYVALQVYFVTIFILNKVLGTNYFYVNKKPDNPSILDFFGDWPNYIIVSELILIPYFLLIYLPFYWAEKKKAS